jgi:hypothetical protein
MHSQFSRRTTSDLSPSAKAAGDDPPSSTKAPLAEEAAEQEWVEDLAVGSREILSINKELIEKLEQENASLPMEAAWIQIDATDETKFVKFEGILWEKFGCIFEIIFLGIWGNFWFSDLACGYYFWSH